MSWGQPRHALLHCSGVRSIVLACGAAVDATRSYDTTADWAYVTCRDCLKAKEAFETAAKVAQALEKA